MDTPTTDSVYTLADLESDKCGIFSFLKGAQSPQFAVFGHPIEHSLSPVMQNAALEFLGANSERFKSSRYFAFDIPPERLSEALKAFFNLNVLGINLTIPHKVLAMHLTESCEPLAESAGACNTLKKTASGWAGYNTDIFGIQKAVEKSFNKSFEGSHIFLLGAGGAARAIAVAAENAKCRKLSIANRSKERLDELVKLLEPNFKNISAFNSPGGFFGLERIAESGTIIINATKIGLSPTDPPVLDFSETNKNAVFFDTPYRRHSQTNSVLLARKCGLSAESGLPMLAWQGARSLAIWAESDELTEKFGDIMYAALEKWTSLL